MPTVGEIIAELQKFDAREEIHVILQRHASVRKLLAGRRKPKQDPKRSSNATVILVLKLKEIWLAEFVESNLKACLQDYDSFWTRDNINSACPAGNDIEIFDTLYRLTIDLESSQAWGEIKLRFLLVFFSNLWEILEPEKDKNSKFSTVSATLHSSGLENAMIYKQVEGWCKRGEKYRALADQLGVGVLFFLPPSISRNRWENTLPRTGQAFEIVARHLEEIGIKSHTLFPEANVLGEHIIRTMINPFIIGTMHPSTSDMDLSTGQGFSDLANTSPSSYSGLLLTAAGNVLNNHTVHNLTDFLDSGNMYNGLQPVGVLHNSLGQISQPILHDPQGNLTMWA